MPRLHIPHPCPADRSQMTPTEQGRYCELCQKEVIDFSRMSDAEIRSVLAKSKGKVCASLREDQVGRYIGPVSWPKRWFALGLGATLLGPMVGLAQTPNPDVEQAESNYSMEPVSVSTPSRSDSVVFRGRVIDAETEEPVRGAAVVIQGTDIGVLTDEAGRYELLCPDRMIRRKDSVTLTFAYLGYEAQKVLVSAVGHEVDVKMVAMDVVFTGEIPLTRWQRFQWWITTPFRWGKGFR